MYNLNSDKRTALRIIYFYPVTRQQYLGAPIIRAIFSVRKKLNMTVGAINIKSPASVLNISLKVSTLVKEAI